MDGKGGSGKRELFGKLRRLRREGAPQEAPPKTPTESSLPAELPAWLKKKLGGRSASSAASQPKEHSAQFLPIQDADPTPPKGLECCRRDEGEFAAKVLEFAPSHVHGTWCLSDVDAVEPGTFTTVGGDPELERIDLRKAVYLDIETTGLSGGAGTIPFMVALGRFRDDGGFELWQGFLRGPEEERAMLAETAERIAAAESVVSFFGKSFDRHRLEDKMRLHGVRPPFEERPHLDLYHPLSRLYRSALPDGRLATMEHGLVGLRRVDDLPGSFAPAAWFDYLAGRAHRLEAVFRHNEDDVLSLVVLAAHLGRTLQETRPDGEPLEGPSETRAGALARRFAGLRRFEEALFWVERAIERHEKARPWLVLRADLWRAQGEVERSLDAYEELAPSERDAWSVHCWIELAKLLEHRVKDVERARAAVAQARELVDRCLTGARRARIHRELERRGDRLAAKAEAAGRPIGTPKPRPG